MNALEVSVSGIIASLAESLEACLVFLSFNYNYLTEIKEIDPNQPIMKLASFGKSTLPEKYPAEYYGVNMKTLTPKTVRAIHEAGSKVYSYTPDTKGQMLSLQRLGVDGVITDYVNTGAL